MSNTFSLACKDTRVKLWIGQGRSGVMTTLYSGDPHTLDKLRRFLNEHRGKHLVLICDDSEPEYGWASDYKEFEDE